ncbi:ribosomal protein S25 [Tribonema minus]|uniref:40S ribosomal protein S25 n=1 Tax=Tribonema minus TaxID=303371 RepID=A0A835ZCY0_9STRA|nr:ribosomal protein S25 [Tribonema minus]|eukprot:TRINITY_DN11681_c0_g1_i1.p2 TRINITY_DN11681_c0_g1~~TRINITY_DN11681_c0_g1_i1.p2  ORF type:complete len:111 (-),score=61.84 TRINITY_DN11681_c0_g1_i1:42-374(-)
MPPKVQQKSKEQKAAAAMAGGKSRKKKWSKNKARDKILNEVLFKEPTYERMMNEVPKMKLVTTSALVERLKINGSLARAAIRELEEKGVIRRVSHHSAQLVYTRATNTEA